MRGTLSAALLAVLFLLPAPAFSQAPPANGPTVTMCGDEVCTLTPDGSVRTYVTHGGRPVYQDSPNFSPDGKSILYVRRPRLEGGLTYEIYSVDVDGSDRRRITHGPPGAVRYDPQITPDGQSIVYRLDRGRIMVVGSDGEDERQIARGYDPSLSPDGTRVAYLKPTGSNSGQALRVVDLDGSDDRQVSPDAENARVEFQDWFPDGEHIGYRSTGGYYRVGADGSNPELILSLRSGLGNPALSPDGRVLAYSRWTRRCYGREPGRLCDIVARTASLDTGRPGLVLGNGYVDDWGPATGPPQPSGSCRGIEATVSGTDLPDVVRGTDGPDVIDAGGGDDTVYGFDSDDLLCGGPGDDEILGGEGPDRLDGGGGADQLTGDADDDRLAGDRGDDRLDGGDGTDACRGGRGRNRVESCEPGR